MVLCTFSRQGGYVHLELAGHDRVDGLRISIRRSLIVNVSDSSPGCWIR